MTPVPADLRRAQIVARVRRDGGVTIAEIARDHAISSMTAHRDLDQLAQAGLVERVRGGAKAIDSGSGAPHPTAWTQRVRQAAAAKETIAGEAAGMVTNGATVFLDASSTALALARRLVHDPPGELAVVTNSPAIAYEVAADALHVVVCPGELDQHTRTIAGRWTVDFLRQFSFDVAFVSAAGITLETGLMTSRQRLADVLQAAQEVALKTIGLVDATKFGRTSLVSAVAARELDAVITDGALPADVAAEYRRGDVSLRVAPASGPPPH